MTFPRNPRAVLLAGFVAVTLCAAARADEKEQVVLEVGDAAPQFTLPDDQGQEWKSADHYGRKIVVVYFYPADMTPGCTKQACGFRDDLSRLTAAGVEVVGISGDSVRNHQLFKEAEKLTYPLLADEQGEVAARFGVPYQLGEWSLEREIGGRKETLTRTATISRWTFVINKDGKIARKSDLKTEKLDPGEDAESILTFVKKLQSEAS